MITILEAYSGAVPAGYTSVDVAIALNVIYKLLDGVVTPEK